jgi:hypothetical protein
MSYFSTHQYAANKDDRFEPAEIAQYISVIFFGIAVAISTAYNNAPRNGATKNERRITWKQRIRQK